MSKFLFPDFERRLFSTLIILGILSTALFLGSWALLILSAVSSAFLTYEWLGVCQIERRAIFWVIVPLLWGAMSLSYMGHARLGFGLLLSSSSLGIFLSWFAWHRRFLWGSLALVYFGLAFTSFAWILQAYDHSSAIVIWTILVVAGSDIGGYVFGCLLKGPKMVPEISPNKTWSGFLGSLLTSILLGGLGYKILAFQTPPFYMSVAAVLVSLVSVFGDLIESLIKRYHHVKDSGHWIPGHGGFLDRLDSYLFVLPVLAWMTAAAPGMFDSFVPTFQEWWDEVSSK